MIISAPQLSNSCPISLHEHSTEKNYMAGYFYNKSVVVATEIAPENQIQFELLDMVDRIKHAKLMQIIDGLTERFGRGKVRVITQGLDGL
ncbi:DNA polymerase V [Pontibacter chinhatensis]|uniref:DNA polymerase V n=1 Tax=Pontibacter chinhatensis TaxID=1436961 RepID=A0A1I2ZCD5_9BACT|nr:DNA polymerase V [Pontibacter chinhatensis]